MSTKRSLYGLKWVHEPGTINSILLYFKRFYQKYDYSLFTRTGPKRITILRLYIDDMLITRDDEAGLRHLKDFPSNEFYMKDLGPLTYFLGLELKSNNRGMFVHQKKYTDDLI